MKIAKELTKKQKIAFCKFVIDIYLMDINKLEIIYDNIWIKYIALAKYKGFCFMLSKYFNDEYVYDENHFKKIFPELYAYKPKRLVKSGHWFMTNPKYPQNPNKNIRLRIAKELLAKLNDKTL